MPGVVHDARAVAERPQERRARRRDRLHVQIGARGNEKRIPHQVREARDGGRVVAGSVGLVVRERQLVLPRRADFRLVGLDLGDHRGQFRRGTGGQTTHRHVGQLVAAGVRQELVRRKQPVVGLAQQRRQVVGFRAHRFQIVVVPVAGQHQHPRRLRPDCGRVPHQGRDRFRRAQAAGQQIADVFENRHARAQPLAGAVVRQFLRRRRQRARRQHQIVDAVRFRQEPGVGRRRNRREQRHPGRFNHREAFVRGRGRPGLIRQAAVFVRDPGRISRFVQRHGQRLRERGGGNRGGPAGAHERGARARNHLAGVFRREAVHHEIAVLARVGQRAAHRQHVGAVGRHAGRNRQRRRRRELVVERVRAHERPVQVILRAMVGIAGRGLRPALHVHLERQLPAAVAVQPERKIHAVAGGLDGSDDEIPIVEIRRPFHRAVERKNLLLEPDLRRQRRRAGDGARRAPRHRGARAALDQVDVVVRVPVRGGAAEEHQPAARRIVDRRNRPPLASQPQLAIRRQRLRIRQSDSQSRRDGFKRHGIEALLAHRDLQRVRRPRPLRKRRLDRSHACRHRRRRHERDVKRPQIVGFADQRGFFEAVPALPAGDGLGIGHRIGRGRIMERNGNEIGVQRGLQARLRLDPVQAKSRSAPRAGHSPRHAPFVAFPDAPHLGDIRPTGRRNFKRSDFPSPCRRHPDPRADSDRPNQMPRRIEMADSAVHPVSRPNREILGFC